MRLLLLSFAMWNAYVLPFFGTVGDIIIIMFNGIKKTYSRDHPEIASACPTLCRFYINMSPNVEGQMFSTILLATIAPLLK